MKLHNVLDDLFACGSKVKILRLLFRHPEKEFTERELADYIEMSPNTVNLAMADLRQTNIVRFKHIGRTNIYRLNKRSVLYPILKELFQQERSIINDLYATIAKVMPEGDTVVIFGSYARDEERMDSDLDILIITNNKRSSAKALDQILIQLIDTHSVVLSPIYLTRNELKKKKSKPFIINAMKEGIVIKGEV